MADTNFSSAVSALPHLRGWHGWHHQASIYPEAPEEGPYIREREPVGMIFVPCAGGLSHCSEEFTPLEDIVRGARVLVETAAQLSVR